MNSICSCINGSSFDSKDTPREFLPRYSIMIYMPINIQIPQSKILDPYSDQLRSITEPTISLVEKLLPIKDINIIFQDDPNSTIAEIGGIGGFTPNANEVFISLNPQHIAFDEAVKNELSFILAHELHHTIRWQKEVEGDTLLEALVFEGLADHFAQEVTGRKEVSVYSNALTPEQKEIILKKASGEWLLPTYDNDLWFFGTSPDIIPRWTGYTLGYDLVGKYLERHPEEKASSLVKADAELFI